MAEFGAYNNIPMSTGTGQGNAQVFKPTAIALDSTALRQGMEDVGQAAGDAKAAKAAAAKAAKLEKEKKEAERLRKANEMNETGVTIFGNSLIEANNEQAMATVLDPNTPDSEVDKIIFEAGQKNHAIQATETALQTSLENSKTNPNTGIIPQVWDEETGAYIPKYDAIWNKVTTVANEEQHADPLVGEKTMISVNDMNKNTYGYDPNYNLQDNLATALAAREKDFSSTIESVSPHNSDYDKITSITEYAEKDRNNFKKEIKKNAGMRQKYIQHAYMNPDNPRPMPDMSNPEVVAQVDAEYIAAVEDAFDAIPRNRKVKQDLTKSASGSGNEHENNYKKVEVTPPTDATKTSSYRKLKESETKRNSVKAELKKLEEKSTEGLTGEEKKLRVEEINALVRQVDKSDKDIVSSWKALLEITNFAKKKGVTTFQIANTTKPESGVDVDLGGVQGKLQSVTADKDGNGYAVINKEYKIGKTEKDAPDSQTMSTTMTIPTIVPITGAELKVLDYKFGFQQKSQEKEGEDGYVVGQDYGGYIYNGGDPADENNYSKSN